MQPSSTLPISRHALTLDRARARGTCVQLHAPGMPLYLTVPMYRAGGDR